MELPRRGDNASPTPAARPDLPRRRFPRTVFTSAITDTKPVAAAMRIAFGRDASMTSTTIPTYDHSWPTTDVIKLLAALLSVPADREAWIYCDSSWAVNSVSTFNPATGRYTWSPPAENYTPSPISMVGKFEIRDLVEEIRRTVARRLEGGYRTWLRLQEGAVDDGSKSETAGNSNSQSSGWI